MGKREYRKAKKEFMYSIIVGDYYAFNIYRVTDAARQVYYIGARTNHGVTQIADTEEELKKLLEAEVPIINDFLAKVK
ncbi:MAG: hypothetical protein J6R83_02735 [Clostridia bacterium]|nr:hypothetical protein [Clostridia bacterium]MBO7714501.1 hypothetical protein [Methanobrevibacter sp.]